MKVHKITAYFIDVDDLGMNGTIEVISGHKNLCLAGVTKKETSEFMKWDDNHPINITGTDLDSYWSAIRGSE